MIRWLTNTSHHNLLHNLKIIASFSLPFSFKHEIIINFVICEFQDAFFLNFSFTNGEIKHWKKFKFPNVNVIDRGTMTRYIKTLKDNDVILWALQIKFANAFLNCNGTCAHDSCLHLQAGLKYSRARIFFFLFLRTVKCKKGVLPSRRKQRILMNRPKPALQSLQRIFLSRAGKLL